eukprot:scaffold7228_cov523-Prasinococcus_capsulatus_cf.AAC.12
MPWCWSGMYSRWGGYVGPPAHAHSLARARCVLVGGVWPGVAHSTRRERAIPSARPWRCVRCSLLWEPGRARVRVGGRFHALRPRARRIVSPKSDRQARLRRLSRSLPSCQGRTTVDRGAACTPCALKLQRHA